MGDELIIKYIKKRKQEGLNILIDKYGGIIRGIIKKHLYNINGYEDECINDVFLSIWNNIDKFSGSGSFKSWIGTIAKFKAIDYKRKYLKLNSLENIDDFHFNSTETTEDNIIKKEFLFEIRSMLNQLNEKDRELFIKYYFNEEKVQTICTDLNMSSTQVYSRLSRGRRKLREIFYPLN